MLVYQKALRDGYVSVYRGRIFLIGQDRAGKTSLKKSLLGMPFDPKEESTEGIDPSKCDINVNRVQNWHFDSKNTILSEVSAQISRSLAVELFPSREVSREKKIMASDVFYVKIVKVSNLQTFIYAFNVCMYCDVAEKGLYVCQLFSKVCVYSKSLIKTICENRRNIYIIVAIAKCQRREKNRMNKSRSDWFFCELFVNLTYLILHTSRDFSRLNSSLRIAFKIYIFCA